MDSTTQPERRKRRLRDAVCDFSRWLFWLIAATAMIALAVQYFATHQLNEEIRLYIERRFQEHYVDFDVTLESARRMPDQGIVLRGLMIREPGRSGGKETIAQVDEIVICCAAGLDDLVTEGVRPTAIRVRGLRLACRRREEGDWTITRLWPLPKFSDHPPPVTIESGVIDIVAEGAAPVRLQDLQFQLGRLEVAERGGRQIRKFAARAASSFAARVELSGQVDVGSGAWAVDGSADGLRVDRLLIEALATWGIGPPGPLPVLDGDGTVRFGAVNSKAGWETAKVQYSGTYTGRLEDRRLPAPLSEIRLSFQGTRHSVTWQLESARMGPTRLTASGDFRFAGESPARWEAELTATDLWLDRWVPALIPAQWRRFWDDMALSGSVDLHLIAAHDGRSLTPKIQIDCHDVSFAHSQFPYPIANLRGRVEYGDSVLRLHDLLGTASGRPIRINGHFLNPGPESIGWLEFSVDEPLPLDETLVAALPEASQRVVRSLDPHGMVTVWGRFERSSVEPLVEQKQLEIGLIDCAILYDRFRYPLYGIRGTLAMNNDHWSFRDLEGHNDSGWVTCHGSWTPHDDGGTLLVLDFNAMDVPLEDELRDALKPEAQHLWRTLQPRGTLDQLRVHVQYASAAKDLSLVISAVKHPEEQNVAGRTITLRPTWMPYEWNNVEGSLEIRNGTATIQNMRARHGQTRLELSGTAIASDEGPWEVQLEPFIMDRVDLSHEFMAALPERLREPLSRLNLSGLVSTSGKVRLSGDARRPGPPAARWHLDVDVEDGTLDNGLTLEHIHGGLTLDGEFDGSQAASHGQLAIDSLMCKGVQLTAVRGPLYMAGNQLWLGQWVPENASGGTGGPLQATVWEGRVQGNGRVIFGPVTQFDVEARLDGADLAAISREATLRRHEISGKAQGYVRLSGNSSGRHTWRGQGNVELLEADIYRLPVMIALLKLLSIKPPDRTAFTSSDVDFRIEGDHIYFDRIDFDGDVISLDGNGEMTFDRQVHLTFGTLVGREDYYISLLRPLVREAGRRLLVIEVTGTLDDPKVKKELVPELNDTLQQLFPGPRNSFNRQSLLPPAAEQWRRPAMPR